MRTYKTTTLFLSFLRKTNWTYLERISWVVIVATALIGIPSLFFEHHFQLQRDRQSATLEFAKMFQDSHLVSKRFALLAPWLTGQFDIRKLREQGATRADLQAIVLAQVDPAYPSSADMRSAIFDIVDFYDTLQLCIENDRCDKAMAEAYFQNYAWEFQCLYEPYISLLKDALAPSTETSQDQTAEVYGQRLKRFATAYGQRPCR